MVAVIWYEKAAPTVPLAVAALVITGDAALIVKVRVAVPVPPLLVAVRVTFETPAVVGVPVIKPVPEFTERPAGSPVALRLVGLLVAVIWYEKATPTVPLAVVELVITGGTSNDVGEFTVSVKLCVAFGGTPLLAVMVRGYVPVVPAAGVPASVAVPL